MALENGQQGTSAMQGNMPGQGGAPMAQPEFPPPPMPGEGEEDVTAENLYTMEQSRAGLAKNRAKGMDKEELERIGIQCKEDYDTDFASFRNWRDQANDWIKLAVQHQETKTYPWPDASNIKYPLVSVAAMQFSARAYPTLVPSDGKIVKAGIIGTDPTGKKVRRAERVSKYMSWQVMHDMEGWEEDFDRMLLLDAVIGTTFKKTYYDPYEERVCSKSIDGRELVINFFAESLSTAARISEHTYMYDMDYKGRVRADVFIDNDIPAPSIADFEATQEIKEDDSLPHFFICQSTWLDIDNDDVPKPYFVTFHRTTGKVLSIYPRFVADGLIIKNNKLCGVKPLETYTKFGFIPNPESRIYDLGFGHLLGPINEAVNTIVNQLVDAGTLSNLQSGFIGKGLRLAKGEQILKPGEWKQVNSVGDDLRKQLVPLPAKEPSGVLFNLLGQLVTSGKELASVAEIFVGKMPGQNTPATTTMASIEQGMKVFTAIYKRIYRSLKEEFKKIFTLNSIYIDPETQAAILDDEMIGPEDFNTTDYDICPGADPTAVSSTERLLKAQGLMELMSLGTLDPLQVTKRILEAQEQPNWQELMPGLQANGQATPPPPDPKQIEMEMKMQAEQAKFQMKQQELAMKTEMSQKESQAKLAMQAQELDMKLKAQAVKNDLDAKAAEHKQKIFMVQAQSDVVTKNVKARQDVEHREMNQAQKMRHNEMLAQQRAKEQKSRPTQTGSKASGQSSKKR